MYIQETTSEMWELICIQVKDEEKEEPTIEDLLTIIQNNLEVFEEYGNKQFKEYTFTEVRAEIFKIKIKCNENCCNHK